MNEVKDWVVSSLTHYNQVSECMLPYVCDFEWMWFCLSLYLYNEMEPHVNTINLPLIST